MEKQEKCPKSLQGRSSLWNSACITFMYALRSMDLQNHDQQFDRRQNYFTSICRYCQILVCLHFAYYHTTKGPRRLREDQVHQDAST